MWVNLTCSEFLFHRLKGLRFAHSSDTPISQFLKLYNYIFLHPVLSWQSISQTIHWNIKSSLCCDPQGCTWTPLRYVLFFLVSYLLLSSLFSMSLWPPWFCPAHWRLPEQPSHWLDGFPSGCCRTCSPISVSSFSHITFSGRRSLPPFGNMNLCPNTGSLSPFFHFLYSSYHLLSKYWIIFLNYFVFCLFLPSCKLY